MLRLKRRQREALSGTLRELANYAIVAFVFSQFVGESHASWALIVAGSAFWIVFVVIGVAIEG